MIIDFNENMVNIEKIEQYLIVMILRKIVLMFYETTMVINLPIYLYTIKNFR